MKVKKGETTWQSSSLGVRMFFDKKKNTFLIPAPSSVV